MRTLCRCVALLAVLSLVAGPPQAAAKAPTERLLVWGGPLRGPVEIVEPQVLRLSHIWAGGFLDSERGAATAPTPTAPRYEIVFEVKFGEGDLRSMYSVAYSPGSGGRPGVVYLPGPGEPGHLHNSRTMMRPREEGHWSYASPAWEAAFRPLLARALAGRGAGR